MLFRSRVKSTAVQMMMMMMVIFVSFSFFSAVFHALGLVLRADSDSSHPELAAVLFSAHLEVWRSGLGAFMSPEEVQCSAVQCSAVQCSAVQYSTVQYSADDDGDFAMFCYV